MTMKKKLAITTMAASLVLGSVSGLPLNNKGAASLLGLSTGVASAASLSSELLAKYNAIHTELAKDESGIAAVRTARDTIDALTASTEPGNAAIKAQLVDGIWTKISPKVAGTLTVQDIYQLVSYLAITYDLTGSDLAAVMDNPDLRHIADQLAVLSDSGVSHLTLDDFSLYYDALIGAVEEDKLAIITAAMGPDPEAAIKTAVKNAIHTHVLAPNILNVSKVLNGLGIEVADMNTATDAFYGYVNTQASGVGNAAKDAAESALLRYVISNIQNSGYSESRSTDGKTLTPEFKVYGVSISDLLNWEVSPSNPNVLYQDNSFKLQGSSTSTVTIRARDKVLHRLIYIGTITLAPQIGVVGAPIGAPAFPSADNHIGVIGSAAIEVLNNIKDQLKDATPENKIQLVAEAQAKVEEAIRKISNMDLSNTITVSGDKATSTFNVSVLVKQIEEITKQAKALNDSLKEFDPNAKTSKVELSLNLGTVEARKTEVPLAKELLQAAKDNGIHRIGIVVNGVKLALSPSEFNSDTTLDITKQDTAVATSATQLPIASDVYEFEFFTGGSQVTTFTTPIQLSIPIHNGDKFDRELLTVAKIMDGKLIIFVGTYKDGHVDASRSTLSTYTVVENKVTFNDTDSVEQWAGRQIQVAAAKGIVEGRGDQTFVPDGQVTRAEFAKMIVKTFGLEDSSASESFSDVNDSDWFNVYVASAVKNGIVNGRAEGKFDPNGLITRAEMAAMAARALSLTGTVQHAAHVDVDLAGFSDSNAIGASLKSGAALSAHEGIVIGEDGGKFNPNANSTRAQAAVVIYRLLNK